MRVISPALKSGRSWSNHKWEVRCQSRQEREAKVATSRRNRQILTLALSVPQRRSTRRLPPWRSTTSLDHWLDELNSGLQPGDVTRGGSQPVFLLFPGHEEEQEGLPCRVQHVLEIQAKNLTDGFTKYPVCGSHARHGNLFHGCEPPLPCTYALQGEESCSPHGRKSYIAVHTIRSLRLQSPHLPVRLSAACA